MLCISYPRRPSMLGGLRYEDVLDVMHDPTSPACRLIMVLPDSSNVCSSISADKRLLLRDTSIRSSHGDRGVPSSILDLNGTAGNGQT
jgi:hypothetical protein